MPARVIHDLNVRDFTYVMANLREDDMGELMALFPLGTQKEQLSPLLFRAAVEGHGYTVHIDNTPVAAFGVMPGDSFATAQGWAFGTSSFKRAAVPISHFFWNKIGHDLHAAGMLRLEVRAMSSRLYTRNWLKKCGFHEDCELKYFGSSGESFHLYSITLDDYNKKFSGRLH